MLKEHELVIKYFDAIKDTIEYQEYQSEIKKLENDEEYQALILNLEQINKHENKEQYFDVKKRLIQKESKIRIYEADINEYIKFIQNEINNKIVKYDFKRKRK